MTRGSMFRPYNMFVEQESNQNYHCIDHAICGNSRDFGEAIRMIWYWNSFRIYVRLQDRVCLTTSLAPFVSDVQFAGEIINSQSYSRNLFQSLVNIVKKERCKRRCMHTECALITWLAVALLSTRSFRTSVVV